MFNIYLIARCVVCMYGIDDTTQQSEYLTHHFQSYMEKLRTQAVYEFRKRRLEILEHLSSWLGNIVTRIDDSLLMSMYLITKTWEKQFDLKDTFTEKDCQYTNSAKRLTLKETTKAVVYTLQTCDSYEEFQKYPHPVDTSGAFVSQFRLFIYKQFQAGKTWKFTPKRINMFETNSTSLQKYEETDSVGSKRKTRDSSNNVNATFSNGHGEQDLKLTIGVPYTFKSQSTHQSIESDDFVSFYRAYKRLYKDFDLFLRKQDPQGFYVYQNDSLLSPFPVGSDKLTLYLEKRHNHLQSGEETI